MSVVNHGVLRQHVELFVKHPVTGQDANTVDHLEKGNYTWRELFMFQRAIKTGVRFHWCDLSNDGHYVRIDYAQAKPILEHGGRKVTIHDDYVAVGTLVL